MPKIPYNEHGYFYDFRHITVDEVNNYPNGIKDIQNRKLDGLIIKNFLNQDEVKTIIQSVEEQKSDIRTKVRTGYTFPRAFAEAEKNITADNPFENNFREWAEWRQKLPDIFRVDLEKKINDVLESMSGRRKVTILKGPSDIGSYTPLTIRVFHPKLGGIVVHCGNMFEELNPNLYADLISKVVTKNQMSFFIQLQNSESGGELTIYDLEWKPGQMGISDSVIRLEDGRELDTDVEGSVKKFTVKIRPGDMLIFAAGEIWHRVENITGQSDRITVGGFLGFSNDDKFLTYWS